MILFVVVRSILFLSTFVMQIIQTSPTVSLLFTNFSIIYPASFANTTFNPEALRGTTVLETDAPGARGAKYPKTSFPAVASAANPSNFPLGWTFVGLLSATVAVNMGQCSKIVYYKLLQAYTNADHTKPTGKCCVDECDGNCCLSYEACWGVALHLCQFTFIRT